MANRIAKFEKVSFKQFEKDYEECFGTEIRDVYDKIIIPNRGTMHSAGYDFYSPIDFVLSPGETIKIPTGIRCMMQDDWVLQLYPRSSLGFKYRLQLNNTVGIIDSDYYDSDNEGHIMAKITNDSKNNKTVIIKQGDRFMQGVFVQYGITEDDSAHTIRNGGIGSTDTTRQ